MALDEAHLLRLTILLPGETLFTTTYWNLFEQISTDLSWLQDIIRWIGAKNLPPLIPLGSSLLSLIST